MIPEMPNPDSLLVEVDQQTTLETDLGIGFLFDFEKGEFVIQNGRMIELSDIEALKMWITKIIKTEKYQFDIYDAYPDALEYQYGTLTEFCVGRVLTDDIKVQLQENIEQSATRHPRVDFLSNWNFERAKDKLTVSFQVNLIDQQSFNMGVTLDGNG
jgi:hypothetical protein